MSHPLTMSRPVSRVWKPSVAPVDAVIAALFIAVYAFVVHAHAYRHGFAESDLYRMFVGILDGANSGQGVASPLHYDREFGFGYLSAIFTLASPATLRDPDRLMALMNQLGFWAMIPGLACFWIAIRIAHGGRVATIALLIMALGPMNPEMFTSGHPTILMFACLSAASVLLFLPVSGWRAITAGVCGFILLLAGMTIRGEIFLAFPWLVLTCADTGSIRRFIVSFILRCIAPTAAIIAFVLIQRHLQATVHAELAGTIGTFFAESYSWVTLAPGFMYLALGCGIVTVLAAGAAFVGYCGRNLTRRLPFAGWVPELLGPLALVATPLLFFLPNPVPTRHFFLVLAGLAILTGISLVRIMPKGRLLTLAIALAIGAGNQVMAEAVRPTLVRASQSHSPYLPVPEEYPTATHANLGWEWRRHNALLARRKQWDDFGNTVRTSCDSHLFVLSDEVEQVFSRLYANGAPVRARRFNLILPQASADNAGGVADKAYLALVGAGATRLPGFVGEQDGKTFIMTEKAHAWPADPVAAILADPAFNDYKIVADPYTMSRFDRTPIPPDRQARFGCSGTVR